MIIMLISGFIGLTSIEATTVISPIPIILIISTIPLTNQKDFLQYQKVYLLNLKPSIELW